jgi:hypothetical protein
MSDWDDWASIAEELYRNRRMPTGEQAEDIADKVHQVEHLEAVARNARGRVGKEADRQARRLKLLLASYLQSFFPVRLPDGRFVTDADDGKGHLIPVYLDGKK